MTTQRQESTLEVRLAELLDRLDRMAVEQRRLQQQNEELRAALARSGASSQPRPTPVSPLPVRDVASSWLNQQVDENPRNTWTDRAVARDGESRHDSDGLWSPAPSVAPMASRNGHSPDAGDRMYAGNAASSPESFMPTARLAEPPLPSVSSRYGRGLDPGEFERVEPSPSQRVPRRDIDLGYINRVDAEDLDKLPYGLIVLDLYGKVLFYNETEARYAGYRPERVVGRNFFADIAPCTRVQEFEGRFNDFVAGRLGRVHFFDFVFNFEHGAQSVLIGLSPGRRPGQVNVMLTRQ